VLSGSLAGGKKRPLGIVTGFVVSFSFFTVFLATIVQLTGLGAEFVRTLAATVVFLFGLIMVVPRLQGLWEQLASRLAGKAQVISSGQGFWGGALLGLSLGLVWAPCVGPIMASVITLAATGNVGLTTVLVALSYSLGTAIPMLLVISGSQRVLDALPALKTKTRQIQQIFGVIMMVVAVAIYTNLDRKFQTFILETFPNYGTGLTALEDNPMIAEQLKQLQQTEQESDMKSTLDSLLAPSQQAPELDGGGNWFNSEPLILQKLRGKVVLIDFWTYSCINCIRTLPYLKAWYDKYHDDGLVIIGVHSPEFEFEKSPENVREAIADFELKYPVVQDNNFAIWRAYNNRYWPAKYLIDKEGNIRYTHFGEGAYSETETKIRELLGEMGAVPQDEMVDLPPFIPQAQTPETYLGAWRLERFASPERVVQDKLQTYSRPKTLGLNQFAYEGSWMVGYQYAAPQRQAKLRLRFSARDVHLVMRPIASDSTQVRVLLDGQPVSAAQAGADVENGLVTLDKDRLYNLIHLENPGDYELTLEFPENNVEVFAFTFG
jgi:cytochrome c biogenesis protein CcdA/thiol-disulfide isomerase/thioredoxin